MDYINFKPKQKEIKFGIKEYIQIGIVFILIYGLVFIWSSLAYLLH